MVSIQKTMSQLQHIRRHRQTTLTIVKTNKSGLNLHIWFLLVVFCICIAHFVVPCIAFYSCIHQYPLRRLWRKQSSTLQQQQQQQQRYNQESKISLILLLSETIHDGFVSSHNTKNSNVIGIPPPQRLRNILRQVEQNNTDILLLPCCYDGLSARMISRCNKFKATFMTGFGVSAVRGYPDTQLLSYEEMVQSACTIAEALTNAAIEYNSEPLPCIADGDTGYGNAINVKRTVFGYARAGMAGIMIEDQVSPKRCGHVGGKSVVSFEEAVQRVKAACDARNEYESLYGVGTGPLVLARTDALKTDGFDEAIRRCIAFQQIAGCDITFLEAPESIKQMKEYCSLVPGYKLANMLEQGSTPILTPQELKQMGYTMAAYPLTLLSASAKAMEESLYRIQSGIQTDDVITSFQQMKDIVGFTEYYNQEARYKTD